MLISLTLEHIDGPTVVNLLTSTRNQNKISLTSTCSTLLHPLHPRRGQPLSYSQFEKMASPPPDTIKEENAITSDSSEAQPPRANTSTWKSTVLTISKRAAIAGAAMTSAPILLPPALLLSAVGLAFSFPFGVYYAGIACTDKFMRYLLLPPQVEEEHEGVMEVNDEEGEFVDGGEGDVSNLRSSYESAVDDFTTSDVEVSKRPDDLYATFSASNDEGSSYSEEKKIWEQLYAIRIVVGYKAVLHSSFIEELRALYLFTGIQPPLSFQDSSDLAEVNEKLLVLKSVVGIK